MKDFEGTSKKYPFSAEKQGSILRKRKKKEPAVRNFYCFIEA